MRKKPRTIHCSVCGVETQKYHTLQVFEGEPLRSSLAEVDKSLCGQCYEKLKLWLAGISIEKCEAVSVSEKDG